MSSKSKHGDPAVTPTYVDTVYRRAQEEGIWLFCSREANHLLQGLIYLGGNLDGSLFLRGGGGGGGGGIVLLSFFFWGGGGVVLGLGGKFIGLGGRELKHYPTIIYSLSFSPEEGQSNRSINLSTCQFAWGDAGFESHSPKMCTRNVGPCTNRATFIVCRTLVQCSYLCMLHFRTRCCHCCKAPHRRPGSAGDTRNCPSHKRYLSGSQLRPALSPPSGIGQFCR